MIIGPSGQGSVVTRARGAGPSSSYDDICHPGMDVEIDRCQARRKVCLAWSVAVGQTMEPEMEAQDDGQCHTLKQSQ